MRAIDASRSTATGLLQGGRAAAVVLLVAGLISCASPVKVRGNIVAPRSELRAIWIETFNTPLNNHADVASVVSRGVAMKANALLVQVRRRGDAWYLDSLEPPPDKPRIEDGFDPLDDLIATAHPLGLEVHAYVIVGAVWKGDPAAIGGLPSSERHVFNRHGGYDPASRSFHASPDNWLTRTLLPDGTAGVSCQGHRFVDDFWIDPGHPDAASYTVDVLTHLVGAYAIDGLHLDRIRYPELVVAGQSEQNGANVGYNATNVARFHRRYPESGSGDPAPSDANWTDWRRRQVTELVRRIYLNAIAIRPHLKVSAAVIAWGTAPTDDEGWRSAEAYWRVYQDWRAWLEEGILDIAIPMNYRRDHDAVHSAQFDRWNEWLWRHPYGRTGVTGAAAYLNSVEGTLAQTRRAVASQAGSRMGGVALFSMATPSAAVAANPLSQPPGQNTPVRSIEELASGLTTGRSIDGRTMYESADRYPPVFAESALVPALPWKIAPTAGHIMGTAVGVDGAPLDGVGVEATHTMTGERRLIETDGGGFFGLVDLRPGEYVLRAVVNEARIRPVKAAVIAGRVTTANLSAAGSDIVAARRRARGPGAARPAG